MKKQLTILIVLVVMMSLILSGCVEPTPAQKVMKEQNTQKADQAAKVMQQTTVPTFNSSLDRENIAKRLKQTNDPNMLQWIYPMSAGRVIGRFPVKGKVTSGSKRLTSPEMIQRFETSGGWTESKTEAPDEMGTYGSSGSYIFWFDPADRYHQHQGDYFLSPVPYKIDLNFGTISVEVDATEEAKRPTYEKQGKK